MKPLAGQIDFDALLCRKVTFFDNLKKRKQRSHITIGEILDGVLSGRWREAIADVRIASRRSKEETNATKVSRLAAFKPSGIFLGLKASDFQSHSGIICIDLDEVGTSINELKLGLAQHLSTLAIFVSPSGRGLKVLFGVQASNEEEHNACWLSIQRDLSSILPNSVKVDPSTRNISSNCFVSHDPNAWIAATQRTLVQPLGQSPLYSPERKKKREVISKGSMSDDQSMSVFIGESMSHELTQIRDAILAKESKAKTRQRAERALRRLKYKSPHIWEIYARYLATKAVNQGERHSFLLRVIPAMYEVVCEQVLIRLLKLHHQSQTGTWSTGIDLHMREVSEVLSSFSEKYRTNLSLIERSVFYDQIECHQRKAAFRVCRGFAMTKMNAASGIFPLSCRVLASRIECHPDTAHRILREFHADRIIKRVKNGDSFLVPLPPGEKRNAATWRWIAPRIDSNKSAF